eukprot:scaffold6807_cov70-Phaeocystis_antarctica.AAC.9
MVRVEDRARDRVRATGLDIGWNQGWGQGLGHRVRDRVWSPHTLNPAVLYIPCSSIDPWHVYPPLRRPPLPALSAGCRRQKHLGNPRKRKGGISKAHWDGRRASQ